MINKLRNLLHRRAGQTQMTFNSSLMLSRHNSNSSSSRKTSRRWVPHWLRKVKLTRLAGKSLCRKVLMQPLCKDPALRQITISCSLFSKWADADSLQSKLMKIMMEIKEKTLQSKAQTTRTWHRLQTPTPKGTGSKTRKTVVLTKTRIATRVMDQ